MSALFGKSDSDERTVLLVDIENGSVASALAQLSHTQQPRLFAEHRVALPVLHTVSGAEIARRVERAVEESLDHTSRIAARIRQDRRYAPMGRIRGAHLFFGPPWTTTSRGEERLQWKFEPSVVDYVRRSTESVVGSEPIAHHPFGRAATHTSNTLFAGSVLLCIVTGEVTELLVIEDDHLIGRATVPLGTHTALRTLKVHAGLSIPEAHSALQLYRRSSDDPLSLAEPLRASFDHFVEQFVEASRELLTLHPVDTIAVIAPEPMGEWFARALATHTKTVQLFPNGGTTRDIRAKHLAPHVSAHATNPDIHLMIEALFAHSLQNFGNAIQ